MKGTKEIITIEVKNDIKDQHHQQFQFDVALSYASEQREYVKRVYKALTEGGVNVFYDQAFTGESWGKEGVKYFQTIFYEAEYVIIFSSPEYREKDWTRIELDAAISKKVIEKKDTILPVCFDNGLPDGVLPTTLWLNANKHSPEEVAQKFIDEKLSELR